MSDFSVARILCAQVGPRSGPGPGHGPGPDRCLHDLHVPSGCGLAPRPPLSLPSPVPVPVPGFLQYQGMTCGHAPHPFNGVYMRAHHHTCIVDHLPRQPLPGYHDNGLGPVSPLPPPPPCPKSRVRTVFTRTQTDQLEAQFRVTDYPTAEERHELATCTGLREDTIRVWFKNRRARRKLQDNRSKVKSTPPPPPSQD